MRRTTLRNPLYRNRKQKAAAVADQVDQHSEQSSHAKRDSSRDNARDASLKQFISLNWLDIVAEEDAAKEYLDAHTPTELLAKKLHSTGYIYKEDDYAIVLCRDEDESNISYLVLPKCVITERKNLFRAEYCPFPSTPIKRGKERKKKGPHHPHAGARRKAK